MSYMMMESMIMMMPQLLISTSQIQDALWRKVMWTKDLPKSRQMSWRRPRKEQTELLATESKPHFFNFLLRIPSVGQLV